MSESTDLKPFHLKQADGDEVEKSIEFLDKVLSEFEDPDSLPHIEQEPDTPTQGNQSEDDGYMSMNGKKELKLIDIESDNNLKNKKSFSDAKLRNDFVSSSENSDAVLLQTTLPKARPLNANPSKYASLPCSTPPKNASNHTNNDFLRNDGRTVVGIDISAVRDAVLRGVARMPETILNEHPVTIYPGRSSPTRRNSSNRKSIGSSRDLGDSLSKSNDDSSECEDDDDDEDVDDTDDPSKLITIADTSDLYRKNKSNIVLSDNIIIKSSSSLSNRRSLMASEDDEFSDDSLENQPQVPTTIILPNEMQQDKSPIDETGIFPPPPLDDVQLSCSAPAKCSPGIAWEINLNEPIDSKYIKPTAVPFALSINEGDSVASTPCNSIMSTDHSLSSDWPDPPEQAVTEDEAGSIITDSEDVIPVKTTVIPNGTYVIRKGKDRKNVFEIPEFVPPDGKESETEELANLSREVLNIEETNDIPPPPMNIPKYRHSIDLPLSSMKHSSIHSPKQSDYNSFWSKPDDIKITHTNSLTASGKESLAKNACDSPNKIISEDLDMPLMRVASLPIITSPTIVNSGVEIISTPRRDLAPPIEEDEEPESESQSKAAPLRQIENNISALLRGDIPIARVPDIQPPRPRPLGFRAGVHKSESAKEMLLSQNMFGALPPSPPSSSADEVDGFPPLPPLPTESNADVYEPKVWTDSHNSYRSTSLGKNRYRDSMENPPPVPPHRCPSAENTLKTMSMDSKCYKSSSSYAPPHTPGSTHSHDRMAMNSRKRMPGVYLKHTAPSPREERRLQTSCSLPETPIFARGCDVPRTPHRRTQEIPTCSRTAPRQINNLNSSIVGIAGSTLNGRPQRNINHALLSSEMIRIAGGPARGWYPKQRQNRPVSNENLDHIHMQGMRGWDNSTSNRKPLTLPPNLSPNFFKKSPTDALRRVTSLLIRNKGNNPKESEKKEKNTHHVTSSTHRSFDAGTLEPQNTHKKKGFFKSFWKKSKHYSIEQ